TPWLTLDTSEGITPAAVNAVLDPQDRSRGSYPATLTIQIAGATMTASVTLIVGPLLRVGTTDPPPQIMALNNRPFTVKFTLRSSGAPLDFVLASRSPYLQISPTNARTSQDIVATIDPAGLRTGELINALFSVTSGDLTQFLSLQFTVFAGDLAYFPDTVDLTAAPGSL